MTKSGKRSLYVLLPFSKMKTRFTTVDLCAIITELKERYVNLYGWKFQGDKLILSTSLENLSVR